MTASGGGHPCDELQVNMGKEQIWIRDGALAPRLVKPDGKEHSAKVLLDSFNMVLVETGPEGTCLHWNMASANWASLMFAADLIVAFSAPYRFRFFNAGWFDEVHHDSTSASRRMEQLLTKSDIRFSQRVYLRTSMPAKSAVPSDLRSVVESGEIPDEQSILCKVDFDAGTSSVERIGATSLLGRVWGHVPISYPAMSGHNFDRIVSQPYFDVLKTGKLHYDQVLASMIMPDGERHWFNYHRVILPEKAHGESGRRVRIACAQAPVEIALL